MPTAQQIITIVEGALLAAPGSLTAEHTLAELPWDSMAMVAFAGEVADHFGVALSVDEIAACATVGDLIAAVSARTSPA